MKLLRAAIGNRCACQEAQAHLPLKEYRFLGLSQRCMGSALVQDLPAT